MATVSFTRTIIINNKSAIKKIRKSLRRASRYSSEATKQVEEASTFLAPEIVNNILDRF